MYVLFSSSSLDVSPNAGSVLWIDDASVVFPTGVEQLLNDNERLLIFPNPSNGIFSINQASSNSENLTIEVYNMLGEKIYSGMIFGESTSRIDISYLSEGIYFVKTDNGKKTETQKIIIQ